MTFGHKMDGSLIQSLQFGSAFQLSIPCVVSLKAKGGHCSTSPGWHFHGEMGAEWAASDQIRSRAEKSPAVKRWATGVSEPPARLFELSALYCDASVTQVAVLVLHSHFEGRGEVTGRWQTNRFWKSQLPLPLSSSLSEITDNLRAGLRLDLSFSNISM